MAEAKKAESEKPAEVTTEAKEVKKKVTTKSAVKPTEVLAKAGKRSKKVQEAEAEKVAKEAKKTEVKAKATAEADKPKPVQKPHVVWYSKNQKAARELIEKDKLYTLAEAVELLPKLSKVKFDATAELHATLNIDPKQADQMVRAAAALPAGTGKTVRVAVLANDKDAAEAKKAGADISDAAELISAISKGKFDFDILVATPDKMPELGRYAKTLGPKGLMPSPKSNTVTAKPAEVIAEIKKGRVELKNDANGIVHASFGKLSFTTKDLLANLKSILAALQNARPSGVKGVYIKSLFVTSSMSPSIKLDVTEAIKEAKS